MKKVKAIETTCPMCHFKYGGQAEGGSFIYHHMVAECWKMELLALPSTQNKHNTEAGFLQQPCDLEL